MTTESPAVRFLREAGWSPDRRVDIAFNLAAYERQGHAVFPAAVEFLREYSGLVVPFHRDGRPDEVWYSGWRACGLIDPRWVEDYSRRAGVRLVPVGAGAHEHLTLLLGEDGSWFGGYDDEFGSIGDRTSSALENLVLGGRFLQRF